MIEISVLITSYNKAKFVVQAIESVLMQRLDKGMTLQVVIIDDGSTDGSLELIRSTIKKYNRPKEKTYFDLFSGEHRGLMQTFIKGFNACMGKYIAVCDCDDYWMNTDKLMMQFRMMENNPGFAACISYFGIRRGEETTFHAPSLGEVYDKLNYDSLLKGSSIIAAQTYFMRREVVLPIINSTWYSKMYVWDFPLMLELLKNREVGFLSTTTAVFRIDGESYTNTRSRIRRRKWLYGQWRIRLHFVLKYGCKRETAVFLVYRMARDIYSLVFGRWYAK